MGVLSEIDSQALCYAVFSQVVPIRKHRRDGVNQQEWTHNDSIL